MAHLLLVEDDNDVAFAISRLAAHDGWTAERATNLKEASAQLAAGTFDIALLDLSLPDGDALSLAHVLAARRLPFIVVSGRDETSTVVAAMKAGAADYLAKPYSHQALSAAIAKATARPVRDESSHSPIWQKTLDLVSAAARAPKTPVLLWGETGTGKEVLARRLHALSTRAAGPFVAVNAACLSESIVESELFGHEAGAFTDAKTVRRGVFELAHGGTLFLDEVGELPMGVQAKLLRVLEAHSFRRVGGERELKVDVRLVTATHRDLHDPASFRPDLMQRLAVFEITLPPLRARGRDILGLAQTFLEHIGAEMSMPGVRLSTAAENLLLAHAWPGNVRELKNALERALLTAPNKATLEPCDFELRKTSLVVANSLNDHIEHQMRAALLANGGNLSATARALNVSRNRLKRYLAPAPKI